MNKRHVQQFISVTVRLVLILLIILYNIIYDIYFSDDNSDTDYAIASEIEEKEREELNYERESIRKSRETEAKIWVESKYSEYITNIREYETPSYELELWIGNEYLNKYITVGELEKSGFKFSNVDERVYSFVEMYGNKLVVDDKEFDYSCTNLSNTKADVSDCYITELKLDDKAIIRYGNEVINFGDTLVKITQKLDDFELSYDSSNSEVNTLEKSNMIYESYTDWKIVLNTAKLLNKRIFIERYILKGTHDKGLQSIEYSSNIITRDTLANMYSEINN